MKSGRAVNRAISPIDTVIGRTTAAKALPHTHPATRIGSRVDSGGR
jgi:hypothetical protein